MSTKYKAKAPHVLVLRHNPQLRDFAAIIAKIKQNHYIKATWQDWDGEVWEIRRVGRMNPRKVKPKPQPITQTRDTSFQYGAVTDRERLKKLGA